MKIKDFNWPMGRDWKDVAYESIPPQMVFTRITWLVAQMHDSRAVKVGPVEPWDGVAAWFKAANIVKAEDERLRFQLAS